MGYRFLKVSSYYRGFLNYYYQNNEEIKNKSYNQQYRHLMDQCFAMADFYSIHLKELGIDSYEIVANATPLQEAWAKHNNIKASGVNLLIAQIKYYKPNVVFFQDSITYNGDFIEYIRKKIPSIKLIIGNICAPFSKLTLKNFKNFDLMITCSKKFLPVLQNNGIKSYILYHGFEKRILGKIEQDNHFPNSDFLFIGSIFADNGFHALRRDLLEELIKNDVKVNFFGNISDIGNFDYLMRLGAYYSTNILRRLHLKPVIKSFKPLKKAENLISKPQKLKISKKLHDVVKAPVFALDMYKVLSKAKIGFNIHIDEAGEYAANMRMFETTGVSTCLLTDHKVNIKDFFEPGKEIVTYKNKDDCIEKANWLVENPIKAKEIAKAGQKRTLEQHTIADRMQKFDKIIKKNL